MPCSFLFRPIIHAGLYLDWNARLDNFAAAVSTRLSESDPDRRISSNDAFKLCYFSSGIARFLFIVQPPRNKWANLFNMLMDRIDSPTDGDRMSLDEDKTSVADHMLAMMHWTEERSRIWLIVFKEDEKAYREWVDSPREEDSIFPDRLFESIVPYASKMRDRRYWGVRRILEAMQMRTEETVRPSFLSSCDMISKYTNFQPVQPQAAGPIYNPTLEKDDLCPGESSGQDQQRSDHASLA